MKSMTGFGSGTATKDGITCTVEIKTDKCTILVYLYVVQSK